MKRFFVSYAISDALSRGARLTRFWRGCISRSADLQAHEQAMNRLDDRLRRTVRNSAANLPPALHDSILEAVRRESSSPSPRTELRGPFPIMRWAAAGALGVILILLAAGGFLRRPSDPPIADPALRAGEPGASVVASTATAFPGTLTLVEELSPYHPVRLTQPLASQIDAVSEDVRDTTRFLMASLP